MSGQQRLEGTGGNSRVVTATQRNEVGADAAAPWYGVGAMTPQGASA